MYGQLNYSEIWGEMPDIHRIVLGNLHANLVAYLSDHSLAVNDRDQNGRTALWWAAAIGNIEAVQILLVAGTDINAQDGLGNTVLHAAICYGRVEKVTVIRTLLDHNPDLTLVNRAGDGCLIYLPKIRCPNNHSRLIRGSLQAGVHPDARSIDGDSILTNWPLSGDAAAEDIDLLLEAGADIDARGWRELTALIRSVMYRRVEMTKTLLERGASLNLLYESRRNLLHYAADWPNLGILEVLLENGLDGVNPREKDDCGQTPEDVFETGSKEQGGIDKETREAFYMLLDRLLSRERMQEIPSDE